MERKKNYQTTLQVKFIEKENIFSLMYEQFFPEIRPETEKIWNYLEFFFRDVNRSITF